MNASTKIIDRLVGRAAQLYTLPAVAAKVLELTNHSQVDSHAVKECIENDPALATKVLRVVNSSLFGLRRQVSNLSQALALLGTKPLKLLVLGFSLPTGLFSGVGASTLGWYWRRTLTKAVAAREICETVCQGPGDEAFIAALLQDLGMLVLIQELGPPYIDLLEKGRQRGHDLSALESASLGFDHIALTASLVTHWGLPKAILDAIVWRPPTYVEGVAPPSRQQRIAGETPAPQRDDSLNQDSRDRGTDWQSVQENADEVPVRPTGNGSGDVGSVVYFAEWVARLLADGRSDALGHVLAVGRHYQDLTPERFSDLVETLEAKVDGLADVLSLELPQATDYRELLALAHARLAEVAADAAGDLLRGAAPSSLLAYEVQSLGAAADQFEGPAVARGPCRSPDSDRGLLSHLAAAAAICRQSRCPLSLLLAELSHADELVLTRGMEGFRQLRSILERACRGLDHDQLTCLPHGEAGFAAILKGCDRQLAVRLGNRLIEHVTRGSTATEGDKRPLASVSVGAATVCMPSKNFPARDLIQAANRCLYGSHSSGGGVVKSIEIF